jgi:hypothetical protein
MEMEAGLVAAVCEPVLTPYVLLSIIFGSPLLVLVDEAGYSTNSSFNATVLM